MAKRLLDDEQLIALCKEWMKNQDETQAQLLQRLKGSGQLSVKFTVGQVKEALRRTPFGMKRSMARSEFLALKSQLRASERRGGMEPHQIMAACARTREAFGWVPTSRLSGRGVRHDELESSGFKVPKIAGQIVNVLEFLEASDALRDPKAYLMKPDEQKQEESRVVARKQAARRMSELYEAAQIDGMASVSLDSLPSGFGPRTPADHKLDAMAKKQVLKNTVPPRLLGMAERCVVKDEIVWTKETAPHIFLELREAFDHVADALGISQLEGA